MGRIGLSAGSANDGQVDFLQRFGTDALAEVNHHRGIEEVFVEVFVQAEEVLEKWVFTNLSGGFLVGDTEALLDDEGPSAMRLSLAGAPMPLSAKLAQ